MSATLQQEYLNLKPLVSEFCLIELNRDLTKEEETQKARYYELQELLEYSVKELIGTDTLSFCCYADGEVYFKVNNSESKENPANRVAITRRLLHHFSIIKGHRSYLFCVPYDGDIYKRDREKAFAKLGFKKVNSISMEWRAN